MVLECSLVERSGDAGGISVPGAFPPGMLPAEGLFVAIGTIPNTDFLEGALSVDEGGYIVADESGVTSVPGVFAAGDVRAKGLRQVVTAVSDGAIAAESAAAYVASR